MTGEMPGSTRAAIGDATRRILRASLLHAVRVVESAVAPVSTTTLVPAPPPAPVAPAFVPPDIDLLSQARREADEATTAVIDSGEALVAALGDRSAERVMRAVADLRRAVEAARTADRAWFAALDGKWSSPPEVSDPLEDAQDFARLRAASSRRRPRRGASL